MATSQRSMPAQPPPSPEPHTDAQEILADFSSDSSSEGFNLITPRKRRTTTQRNQGKAKRTNNRRTPPTNPGTSTQNRFNPLSEPDDATTDQPATDDEERPPVPTNRRKTPPPIILCGKPEDHRKLTEYLRKNAPSGFHIKYTTNNANIFISDLNERKLVISDLALKQMPFFTYSASNEKTHGYVIRGLDSAPEPNELLDELKINGVNVRQVFKMKTVARPLYLVVTSSDTTLSSLNSKIKYLFYTRVEWERHLNKKLISQCHKCQKWGHATTNCYMPAICLKCAGPHPTANCKKPIDLPAKCANCSQDHPANSTSCPVYKRRIEERNARQQRMQPRGAQAAPAPTFVEAPLPARNIWAERAAAHQQAQVPMPRPHINTQRTAPHSQINTQNYTPHQQPPLQPPPQQQPQQHPPQHQPLLQLTPDIQPQAAPQVSPSSHRQDINKISDLMQQIKLLSQKVNIDGMLQALKDLNKQLDSATDPAAKFMTFVNFTQDINKYNI